jgi:hypothetical protein
MEPTPDCVRDLAFAALLAETQGLVGERVTVEVAAVGHPIAMEVRGTLAHLCDFQLAFGRPLDAPSIVALCLKETGAWFSLREAEIVSARAYTVDADDGLGPARHIEILMRGGLELTVGIDRLAQLIDAQSCSP